MSFLFALATFAAAAIRPERVCANTVSFPEIQSINKQRAQYHVSRGFGSASLHGAGFSLICTWFGVLFGFTMLRKYQPEYELLWTGRLIRKLSLRNKRPRFTLTNQMAFQIGSIRHYPAALHASPFFIMERWLCVFILLGAFWAKEHITLSLCFIVFSKLINGKHSGKNRYENVYFALLRSPSTKGYQQLL